MKPGTIRHPKVHALAGILKVPVAEAVGILQGLWEFTMGSRPDGNLAHLDPAFLAGVVQCRRSGAALVKALLKARLLDKKGRDLLYVHDWHEHCEYGVHTKLARGGRTFANGALPSLRRLPSGEREGVARMYGRKISDFPTWRREYEDHPLEENSAPIVEESPRFGKGPPATTPRQPVPAGAALGPENARFPNESRVSAHEYKCAPNESKRATVTVTVPVPVPEPEPYTLPQANGERLFQPSEGRDTVEQEFVDRLVGILDRERGAGGPRQATWNRTVARRTYAAIQRGEYGPARDFLPGFWERVVGIGQSATKPWGAFVWYLKQTRKGKEDHGKRSPAHQPTTADQPRPPLNPSSSSENSGEPRSHTNP